MNDTSIVTMSTACGTVVGGQRARVDAFEDDDARIVPQPPIELPVADVERDDAGGAAPQQHVGEAAGRRADVERARVRDGRCANASSACASFTPPRPTYG